MSYLGSRSTGKAGVSQQARICPSHHSNQALILDAPITMATDAAFFTSHLHPAFVLLVKAATSACQHDTQVCECQEMWLTGVTIHHRQLEETLPEEFKQMGAEIWKMSVWLARQGVRRIVSTKRKKTTAAGAWGPRREQGGMSKTNERVRVYLKCNGRLFKCF